MDESNDNYPKRKKLRLEGYDYSTAANYFITIVVQERLCLFGEIVDGQMVLNEAGIAIEQAVADIPNQHDGCLIFNYVIMPNHVHFILTLLGDVYLAEVMRQFKCYTTHVYIEGVKTKGWRHFNKRLWQHNYYEHIIRNHRAFEYIANYIFINPQRWGNDCINPSHVKDVDDIIKNVLVCG